MEEHRTFDAKTELVVTKCVEMVAESIPKKANNNQALHLPPVPSYDVDHQKRKETPDFYGYIPDGGSRTVKFGYMLLNSSLLLLIRSFGAAMLMLVEKRYLAMWIARDMALYLLRRW